MIWNPADLPNGAITRGQEHRVCVYWYRGTSGKVGITVVAANAVCPAWTETLAWSTATRNNSLLNIEFIRLGTPQLNNFAAGDTIVYKIRLVLRPHRAHALAALIGKTQTNKENML